MKHTNLKISAQLRLSVLVILVLFISAACGSTSALDANGEETQDEDNSEIDMEEHEEDRIPNNGAVIRILSPGDGTIFPEGEDVLVEIETENFVLDDEGSHWHIYIDGKSWGMIVGGDTNQALRGIEPGEHEISVYLAFGTHEELEEGASIHITVEAQ